MQLLHALASYSKDAQPRDAEYLEHEVCAQLQTLLEAAEQQEAEARGHAAPRAIPASIPTFYRAKAREPSLQDLVRQEAVTRAMQIRSGSVLHEDDLKQICYLLEEYGVPVGDELKINYDGFSQVATRCRDTFGPRVDSYFRASTFLRFQQDHNGAIAISQVLQYLTLRSHMQQTRVQLSSFDPDQTGVLTEQQLEDFIRSVIPDLACLEGMPPSFVGHYCTITARKFLFFHGRSNSRIRIRELANSHVLHEMMELRSPGQDEGSLLSNWFSLQSSRRVYNTFCALDEDANGQLSRREFAQISNGTMSALFIDRIFEEHVLRKRPGGGGGAAAGPHGAAAARDQMDLVGFADFVLAWDHRSNPAAIRYFFDVFDLRHAGSVGPAELYTFFREIHTMWVEMGEYADLSIYDVVDEILDLVKPSGPGQQISRDDLRACGMSGVFFSILSDVKQFFEYNYRENLMHSDDSGGSA